MSQSITHIPVSLKAPLPVRWRIWPVRDDALKGVAVVAGLLLVGIVVGLLTARVYLALLAFAAVTVPMWRFLLPVEYEINGKGVDQWVLGRWRQIPWYTIRRYKVRNAGVLLLPDEDRSGLAPLRGLYLPWRTHREEVLAQVSHYLGEP
jgi:hypothetical protein